MIQIVLKIDGVEHCGECFLGATLGDFLLQVAAQKHPDYPPRVPDLLRTVDGAPVVPEYSLVQRWNGQELFAVAQSAQAVPVPAITPEQLFSKV